MEKGLVNQANKIVFCIIVQLYIYALILKRILNISRGFPFKYKSDTFLIRLAYIISLFCTLNLELGATNLIFFQVSHKS